MKRSIPPRLRAPALLAIGVLVVLANRRSDSRLG